MTDRHTRVGPSGDATNRRQPDVGDHAVGAHGPAIFSMDTRGLVTSWNDRCWEVCGYRGEEIIGQHCSALYPADRVAARFPEWDLLQAARTGLYLDQGWRVRKNGSKFWSSSSLAVQRSDSGSLHGYVAVIQDESEARARHQRSSRRFTELFDLAPVGIALLDEHDRVLHANKALCELLGYELEVLHGRLGTDLVAPEERSEGLVPPPLDSDPPHEHPLVQARTLGRADGVRIICNVHRAVSMEDSGTRFWQVVFQDVTEQHQQVAALQHRATHDELTGLPNRAGIHGRLDELLGDCEPGRVAVLFCDLDNFKRVNDSLGHAAGDELLVTLARRLAAGVPDSCVAARLFGDEFLVVCSDLDAVGGLHALTTTVSGLLDTVVSVRDQPVWLSASIGAAVVDRAGTTSQDLVRFSDAAMFAAKRRRAGGVAVANEELIAATSGQVQEEGRLRETIRHGGLSLQYQPIVARDGSIVMAEALMRWPHPQFGVVGPSYIIPVAEQGNLMRELDRSVLRTALREAATWPPVGGEKVSIAVNLGGLLPDDARFAEDVAALVEESGIDPRRVVLEVVETSLNDLSERKRADMVALSRRGVRFAIDDFGTAYSSMQRLKELPAQIIKIDRGFVSDMVDNDADATIVRAIVEISRGLDCCCIAEGVERAEEFRCLESLGVDAFQGFLFSRPRPAPDFRALLEFGGIPVEGM